jgi:hypothetical protein
MKVKMRDFSEIAMSVWAETDVDRKRELLTEAVNGFVFKGKNKANVTRFIATINKANDATQLDNIVAQLALFSTDPVVKL